MANELGINYPTGATLYVLLFDAVGRVYNGSTFETPASANWANYDLAMSEAATATGIYRATMPTVAAGVYSFVVRKQAGGSPAVADTTVGVGSIQWSGTAEIVYATTATVAMSSTQAAQVAAGSLAIRCYHTFSQSITSTSTAALNTATKLWLALKAAADDADSAAVVFLEATGGLTVLAGATYATIAHGTLVLSGSSGAWQITAGLDEAATSLLTAYAGHTLYAEIKALVGSSTVAVWDGVAEVSRGIVQAIV